jgi:hypothetical protein
VVEVVGAAVVPLPTPAIPMRAEEAGPARLLQRAALTPVFHTPRKTTCQAGWSFHMWRNSLQTTPFTIAAKNRQPHSSRRF